jgi:integrase
MARKVGQIIRRGERTWLVRMYLGRDAQTRERKYFNHTIHGPAKQAQMYLTKKLRERDLRRGVEGIELTLDEYLDRWLQTAAKPRLRPKSYDDYESLLRRYIRPVLGDKLLSSVSTLDIQGAYQQMIDAGLSSRTVRYTHAVLRSAMRQASKWKLLFEDPIAGVQLPRDCRCQITVLSLEQVRAFLKTALATPLGPVFAVAVTTGMRPSEYLGLKWSDVDWQRGTVSVTRLATTQWTMAVRRHKADAQPSPPQAAELGIESAPRVTVRGVTGSAPSACRSGRPDSHDRWRKAR